MVREQIGNIDSDSYSIGKFVMVKLGGIFGDSFQSAQIYEVNHATKKIKVYTYLIGRKVKPDLEIDFQDVRGETPEERNSRESVEAKKPIQEEQPQESFKLKESRTCLNPEPLDGINTLSSIVSFLESQKFDAEKHYFYFEIDPNLNPITAEEIQALLSLPYEVCLTEANGHIILETGTENSGDGGPDYLDRRDHSKLSMHTHPIPKVGNFPANTPSFSDVLVSESATETTPLIVATPSGIIHYQKPNFNPLTKEPFTRDTRDMVLIYAKNHGVDIFNPSEDINGLKGFFNLSQEEQFRFQRKFAEETGVIIYEALWGNEEDLKKILALVNLQTAPKEADSS